MQGKLARAQTPDRTRVYQNHYLVQEYIHRRRPQRTATARLQQVGPPQPPATVGSDLEFVSPEARQAAFDRQKRDEADRELIRIYIPIAEHEVRKHNGGTIPPSAAMALDRLRAIAAGEAP